MNKQKGLFITVEGPDGSGKTSVGMPYIVEALRQRGYDVITAREPGGTAVGEQLRDLILTTSGMATKTEILLFAAARSENVDKIIRPAIEEGKIVIFDRFHDSSYAYQGMARGNVPAVLEIQKFVLGDLEPDCTLFFDVTLEESRARVAKRFGGDNNHFDHEREEFRQRVYEGYQTRLRQFPFRMYRVNAMQPIEGVKRELEHWLNTRFAEMAERNNIRKE